MIGLIRSQLYRMATIRSSWVSIALLGFAAAAAGVQSVYWWAMVSGIGAFGISALTVAQHYQHRTIALLYLTRPKRLTVLLAQVITTVAAAWVVTALSGITVLIEGGSSSAYQRTLILVSIMAVFGAATAAIVRRSSWLIYGFAVWFVLVEGLAGQLKWPLPISSYLEASGGDAFGLELFIGWAVVALAVAVPTLSRDLTGD